MLYVSDLTGRRIAVITQSLTLCVTVHCSGFEDNNFNLSYDFSSFLLLSCNLKQFLARKSVIIYHVDRLVDYLKNSLRLPTGHQTSIFACPKAKVT